MLIFSTHHTQLRMASSAAIDGGSDHTPWWIVGISPRGLDGVPEKQQFDTTLFCFRVKAMAVPPLQQTTVPVKIRNRRKLSVSPPSRFPNQLNNIITIRFSSSSLSLSSITETAHFVLSLPTRSRP